MLLRAIDDLDFAAKIHSSAGAADRRADLARLVEQAAASLRESAAAKDVQIEVAGSGNSVVAAVEPELAERLLVRLAAAAIERMDAGERLRIALDQTVNQCRVSVGRPAALRNLNDAQLFDADGGFADAADGQVLSVGFALRLVRGLARIAGG